MSRANRRGFAVSRIPREGLIVGSFPSGNLGACSIGLCFQRRAGPSRQLTARVLPRAGPAEKRAFVPPMPVSDPGYERDHPVAVAAGDHEPSGSHVGAPCSSAARFVTSYFVPEVCVAGLLAVQQHAPP